MKSKDTPSATGSVASQDGPSLFNLLDGLLTVLFGQEAAPASHSARQAKDSPKRTNGTSGLSSLTSSASAALSMSLGSRLQARLATVGSMEYRQTWKQKATPAGRPYWAHIPSNRPINAKDCTGWPTTGAGDEKWRISTTEAAQRRAASGHQVSLECAAHLAGWTTPDARAMNDGENLETWDARQVKNKEKHGNGNGAGMPIAIQCKTITGWPTPMALDHWMASTERKDGGQKQLPNIAAITGLTSPSSTAETGKPAAYQLNPHFSRWLMGFPPEWCDCAVTAMQSFLNVRKPSSKRTSK